MPALYNEEEQIEEFHQLMETELGFKRQAYWLADDGKRFLLDFMVPLTANQLKQAKELLEKTLNKDVK